ncbi:tyrosine-type recombinase/integrase [Brucella haematophila]|uniref:tyrosine-type recombinase/integrase n=1 Tax=Brucella haematophila TaxID=419474 RepID=UPI00110D65FD|nr:site-specific integrase [Brucella haematophila]TMU86567.1 site-specific integrase [Brucella haematophila]
MAKIKKRSWENASGQHEAWQLDFTDRLGKRHREQFTKKREAEARLAELIATTGSATYKEEAKKTTVADVCDDFYKAMELRHKRGEKVVQSYLRTTKQHFDNWINPTDESSISFENGIGEKTLAELTTADVIKFRDDMRNAGAGIVTTRRVLGTLSRTLKHGIETNKVGVNVAKGVRVIGKRDEGSERVTPPSKMALAAILNLAKAPIDLRIRFAAATGLRASEQWALRWTHIDMENGHVSVETRVDAYGEFDTTKSGAGRRTVPIGKAMIDQLKAWKATSKHNGFDDFVFTDSRGGFIRHTNFMKRDWKPLIAKTNAPDIGWHALRHYAISTWIEAGLSPKAVQTLAGHASYAITMNRYGHLFPSDDHKAAFDRIAETLAS